MSVKPSDRVCVVVCMVHAPTGELACVEMTSVTRNLS